MTSTSKRAVRWAAPVALVGAVALAACGDTSSTETVRTASPSEVAAGSDEQLVNYYDDLARQVRSNMAASDRLTGQAEQYENAWRARSNVAASDRLTGQAERYDEGAWRVRTDEAASDRLTGQAERYDEGAWRVRSDEAASDRLTGQAERYER